MRCEETGIVGNQVFFREKSPDLVTLPQLLRQRGWFHDLPTDLGEIKNLVAQDPATAQELAAPPAAERATGSYATE